MFHCSTIQVNSEPLYKQPIDYGVIEKLLTLSPSRCFRVRRTVVVFVITRRDLRRLRHPRRSRRG